MGLSFPELVYSCRCAWVAGPPRNFLTCLDRDSPVLESGDRSSSLTHFSGTCVFSSVCAKRGAESRSLLVLSCPELDILFGRSAQKRGTEFDKVGLSHPELVYSRRCASIAGPPRNFLTCLDQESPVLESGDRSSNLTLFSGTCVFSSVYANAGPSREACLSCLVRNLCILFGARKSVVPS